MVKPRAVISKAVGFTNTNGGKKVRSLSCMNNPIPEKRILEIPSMGVNKSMARFHTVMLDMFDELIQQAGVTITTTTTTMNRVFRLSTRPEKHQVM